MSPKLHASDLFAEETGDTDWTSAISGQHRFNAAAPRESRFQLGYRAPLTGTR